MDEEIRISGVVHDEEERQSELFGGGNEVEEHIECRYAGAIFSSESAMQLGDERNCTSNE